jgi:ligand-binding sensor domain-containing protein
VHSDSLIFAGCDDGLFLSSDDAQTWKRVSSFPSISVYSIIGVNGSIPLAGTANGIYRSDDGGKSWSGPIPGTKDYIVLTITTLPDGEFLAGSFKKGILISTDHGMQWKEIFPGHTIQSFVSTPDGIFYCISDGKKILCSKEAFDRWEEFKSGSINNLPLMTLYADGNSLYAGTAEGVYFYSDGSTEWKKILERSLITGILKNEDKILFCSTEEDGIYSLDGKNGAKEYTVGCPYNNIMCLGGLKGRLVIVGTTDGKIALSPSYDSTKLSSTPLKKTWQNSTLLLSMPLTLGTSSSLSIGLSAEIHPMSYVAIEICQSIGVSLYYHQHLPFQARCKIYPALPLGLFAGVGYFHFQGFYEPGGMSPNNEYFDSDGQEFFIGSKFVHALDIEIGWRRSNQPWRIHFHYPTGEPWSQTAENQYLNELYFTANINLVCF